jgi:hypothetical protein
MTEAEWLACEDPVPMLEFLRGKASDRKLRLFACACCRRVRHLLPDRRSRKALEASERFADGLITAEKLQFVRGDARWAANVATRKAEDSEGVKWIVAHLTEPDAQRVLFAIWPAASSAGRETEQPVQCDLFRDIIGNPFRPITFDPSWFTSTVTFLAQAIYADRAFDRLPILADALEDAGCINADILSHCRQPGEHCRGCWVVDLLLGKE